MKTRKFHIEWQLYKTYFKNRMPAKTGDEMEDKMNMAFDMFYYFIDEHSQELAYNVINWLDGLVIAFSSGDERRGIIEDTIAEIKEEWNESSDVKQSPRYEDDSAFEYDYIKEFIQSPSWFYKEHVSSSFDWNLLFENMVHNLDMLNKWMKKAYVHEDGLGFVGMTIQAANEFDKELPKKAADRWQKAIDRYQEIQNTGEKSTHKFLY